MYPIAAAVAVAVAGGAVVAVVVAVAVAADGKTGAGAVAADERAGVGMGFESDVECACVDDMGVCVGSGGASTEGAGVGDCASVALGVEDVVVVARASDCDCSGGFKTSASSAPSSMPRVPCLRQAARK